LPTDNEIETIKQQLLSIQCMGGLASFKIFHNFESKEAHVMVCYKRKVYKFCDPDWAVIIQQLAQLWKTLNSQ
jgi:hypothetical protein